MYFSEIKKLEKQYVAGTYARFELDLHSGHGAVAKDSAGDDYIDFSSGIGVNSMGFSNPDWVNAVKAQLDLLAHSSNLFYTQPQLELAKMLCERTKLKRVFFSNSGAEANECAIKTARKYGSDNYSSQRCEIITLTNSFHGRTIATLAATGQDSFHTNFGPFPDGFLYAVTNDVADLQSKVSDKTCAIMIECIQGEGGVNTLDKEFIKAIQDICTQKDILLIVDEVQTGVGRTGKFLSCSHFKLQPDIVTLAKGLGGGLPIGATLFGEKTKNTLAFGDHGSTFGGNPIVCAGAISVMGALDAKLMDEVTEKGDYFADKLVQIDGVTGVSGMGLMIGISIEDGLVPSEIAAQCIKQGLIILTAKTKLRLLPPLKIAKTDIDSGIKILEQAIATIKQKNKEAAKLTK